ncbi:MAG: polyprenyl synthetase family protein [Planctomycetes bacterium]|nr:polyprenyl synthetase family protein [Planctomycetota bacterium]
MSAAPNSDGSMGAAVPSAAPPSEAVPSAEVREVELHELTAPIAKELDASSDRMIRELDSDSEAVREVLGSVHRYRGKRLRAANVLLVGRACEGPGIGRGLSAEHIKIAAIVELIHVATLVHDDVLDRAEVRRRTPTVNARHGNQAAVLLGDWIYARAFGISTKMESQTCSRVLADVTATICRGEIEQCRAKYNFDLTEEEYLRAIDAKTAELYAAACLLGAHYAGASDALAQAMERFGRKLGLAFQIVDDCLDLDGSEDVVGKSLGTDIAEGKITLPIIDLLRRVDSGGRRRLEAIFRDESDPRRVATLAREFDLAASLHLSYQTAERLRLEAVSELDALPASRARDCLRGAADYVLRRRW